MIGRREFAVSGLSLGAAAALTGASRAQAAGADHHAMPTEAHEECAEACAECQQVCDACATHCAHMLHAGKKEHFDTLMTCRDCADFCATASEIVARGGPELADQLEVDGYAAFVPAEELAEPPVPTRPGSLDELFAL